MSTASDLDLVARTPDAVIVGGMRQAERELLDWAAEHQLGLFTRWQVMQRGVMSWVIDQRLSSGAWIAVHPGVYRAAGTPLTWHGRVLAAVLAVEDPPDAGRARRAAASGAVAAALLGIERAANRDTIEVVVEGTTFADLRDVVVHRTAQLPSSDIQKVGRVPATTGTRTVVDLATRVDRAESLAIADEAIAARCTSADLLHRRSTDLAHGRRNVAYLARMTGPHGREELRSWLERYGKRLFLTGGLPKARWNVPLLDGSGRRVAVADAVFDPWPLIVELDGPRFHDPPGRRDHDRRRDRKVIAMGYIVLRFGYWEVVREGDAVVAEIRAALDRLAPRRPVV